MKTKMIVLGGLLSAQIVFLSNNVYGENSMIVTIMKSRHSVHVIAHKKENLQRSTLPVACGYIEENQFVLSFSFSLENRKIRVVDSETGQQVFDDTVTGTAVSILLDRDSNSFDVYIGSEN